MDGSISAPYSALSMWVVCYQRPILQEPVLRFITPLIDRSITKALRSVGAVQRHPIASQSRRAVTSTQPLQDQELYCY